MRKRIVFSLVFILMFLPGCVLNKTEVVKTQPKKVAVWWGTKEEIKAFLDSPEAQANRWIIESIGE